jgi:hypothetical protein
MDLFNLLTASRLFQAEAERRIYHAVHLSTADDIERSCKSLLSVPRFWPLIESLDIWQISNDGDPEIEPFATPLAALLEKLVNLIALYIRVSAHAKVWSLCGRLFEHCTFQLRVLYCHFTLDADFAAFLEKQSSIVKFEWSPIAAALLPFPRNAHPHLKILSYHGLDFRRMAPFIVPGRPITHIWSSSVPPRIEDIVRSTQAIEALCFCIIDWDLLKDLPEGLPYLRYLGIIDYESVDVCIFYNLLNCL